MRKVTRELETQIRSDLHWVHVEPGAWTVWRDVTVPVDAVVWHRIRVSIHRQIRDNHDSDAFDTTRPLP